MSIPLPVQEFAKADSLDGGITPAHPIMWREDETEWVIVYEDGRKIRHPKAEKRQVEHNLKTSRTDKKQDRKD